MARALNQLSYHNVANRDINPGNIFISDNDSRLGDFGIAKSLDDNTNTCFEGSHEGRNLPDYYILMTWPTRELLPPPLENGFLARLVGLTVSE